MSDIDLTDHASYRVWTRDTIRYSDLDPNDHVNNGAINAYLEDGRVRFRKQHLSHLGAGILAGFVLVKYTIEYRAMLHFPGEVDIGTTIIRIGGSSYTQGQAVFRDDTCIATAQVVTVRLSADSGRSMPLDDVFKQALRDATGFVG
jgi:acyl-CoA thioester hydrolase